LYEGKASPSKNGLAFSKIKPVFKKSGILTILTLTGKHGKVLSQFKTAKEVLRGMAFSLPKE
jgi:hypothetical protein